jgi:GNAT superfamily N-acetyltransferase
MTRRDPSGTPLIVEPEPNPEHIRFLEERLYEFNVAATGIADGRTFGLFLRDAGDGIVGGAYGWTWGSTCYIRYVFVPASLRNQGHGTRLMRAIEHEAKARDCRQIVLETHDFQAPRFYEKLGFKVVGQVADYPRGHRSLTLVKPVA